MSTTLKIKSGSETIELTLTATKDKNFRLADAKNDTICRGYVSANCKDGDIEYFWLGAQIIKPIILAFLKKNVFNEYKKQIPELVKAHKESGWYNS